jgi:predicted DNA binding CopG/RHH family protein
MTSHIHPSAFLPLDEEEAKLMESIENDEWKPLSKTEEEQIKKQLQESAEYYSKKTKPISIRLQQTVLGKLKEKSRYNGIPYQSIISILAKQYAEGKINIQL